jgi:hypothetical protein
MTAKLVKTLYLPRAHFGYAASGLSCAKAVYLPPDVIEVDGIPSGEVDIVHKPCRLNDMRTRITMQFVLLLRVGIYKIYRRSRIVQEKAWKMHTSHYLHK